MGIVRGIFSRGAQAVRMAIRQIPTATTLSNLFMDDLLDELLYIYENKKGKFFFYGSH
jgi:hypothetical protein